MPAQSFPSSVDYAEALQNPNTCLSDRDLARARPALSRLGVPLASSGNLACVFRLEHPDGRKHALRCFTKFFDDQQRRYLAISSALGRIRSSWRVGFEFQPRGIRVAGRWYPVLKMEWADGLPLDDYVRAHLRQPDALLRLATRFATVVEDLQRHGIAHGDLQHGNILVGAGGELRLIDYDGLYVPALSGLTGNELGHPNYQHPRRRAVNFGPGMDRFSAWVIYVSLLVLSYDPELWSDLEGGDECLLLRRADYLNPARLAVRLGRPGRQPDRLVALVADLAKFSAGTLAAVPTLASLEAPTLQPPGGSAGARPGAGMGHGAQGARPAPPWVIDHRAYPASLPSPSLTAPRVVVVVASALLLVLSGLARLGWADAQATGANTALTALVALVGQWLLFSVSPNRRERRARRNDLAARRKEAAAARRKAEKAAARHADVVRREQWMVGRSVQRQQAARQQEHRELTALSAERARRLADLQRRRLASQAREAAEVAKTLDAIRQHAVVQQLRRRTVAGAILPGIGDASVAQLAAAGIRTAADFVDVRSYGGGYHQSEATYLVLADGRQIRVPNIGRVRGAQLLGWRRSLEADAQASLPASLPPSEATRIHAAHAQERAALDQEEGVITATTGRQHDEAIARWAAVHAKLAAETRQVQAPLLAERTRSEGIVQAARSGAAWAEAELKRATREAANSGPLTFTKFLRAVLTTHM